ncbi:response regulator transcription factor [Paenibacillus sp. chi10]|uniref:Response regulator transcription factor n=1 Tax=Paenibacillus suaedae TaxID=3077233 RepID=A0AAJ2JU06_9BACL|nr:MULTISPECIES: response regulator transcription factor [Paenibacillus]MDT8977043.1 response regulator transcription factor [Paenibacillus sp. chi10]GAV12315.1 transcriptional regulatory protein YvrH [Paenibacillus sp. NAIST15-1]
MNLQEARILIVEDELALSKMVQAVLQKEGMEYITCVSTGEEAIRCIDNSQMDLIILDVMLPGKSGFDIAPFIRQKCDAPIIFVTARTTDLDKLTGFALGGDDYVTKPFNPLELAARAKALLKRYMTNKGKPEPSTATSFPEVKRIYRYGDFQLDAAAGELRVRGKVTECPAMVFQLLLFFCEHPNRIFSKSELYERVWGYNSLSDDNTVMVHIHRIRERIEDQPSNPRLLVTVRGLGYKLVPPEKEEDDQSEPIYAQGDNR